MSRLQTRKKTTIVWNIRALAEKRGITNAYQFHSAIGVSHPRAKKMWVGTAKLSIEDIRRLCGGLECVPSDLFADK